MNEQRPKQDEIDKLMILAHNHLSGAKSDYATAIRRWEIATKAFASAFSDAYSKYSTAIEQSEKLKRHALDISFVALTVLCGQAFGWVKAALIANSEYYRSHSTHAFGISLEKFSGDLAKLSLQKLSKKSVHFKMPQYLSQTNPHAFKDELECIFLRNTQVVLEIFNDLIQFYTRITEELIS